MNKTTRTLALIVAICIALAVYFVLLGQRGIQLIQDGGGAAIGLGIGVLGTLLGVFAPAMPSTIAHATPWGYYSLATVAEYQGEELMLGPPAGFSIAALAVLAAVAFTAVTAFFDHKEA